MFVSGKKIHVTNRPVSYIVGSWSVILYYIVLLQYSICLQVRYILDDIMDRVPEPFNLVELMGKVEELTPYTIVALQECERMNRLMGEIRRSLKELELGLKVYNLCERI